MLTGLSLYHGFVLFSRDQSGRLACAAVYEMGYLLTWNCKHLANGVVIQRLQTVNLSLGRLTPVIVTPEELLEVPEGE